jgi:soluble lytic murein transglycosylase-like protein
MGEPKSELKTSRPYQERFLDGYERSQLRQEVQKVKPRFSGLRRKYATWALGASLALGGLGVPMKMIHDAQGSHAANPTESAADAAMSGSPERGISADMQAAKSIASKVAGGVAAVTQGVEQAASKPLDAVTEAPKEIPKQLGLLSDQVKETFFKKEIPFGSIIYSEARKNNLNPALVAAVVHTESKFQPAARSAAGAIGLMQLVPKTGRWMGAQDLTNPAQNISAGVKYLRYLSDRFGGDEQKMIAAYNAGEGNVRRFNGVPPFRETRNYVQRVNSFQQDLGARMDGQTADLATATLAR